MTRHKRIVFIFVIFISLVIVWFGSKYLSPLQNVLNIKQFVDEADTPDTQAVAKRQHHFDVSQLKKDWCRVRSKLFSWREILGTCHQKKDAFMKDKRFATSAKLSHVTVKIKGAGEHTSLRIDTYTQSNTSKSFGGDSYRVVFRGEEEVISAAVFDLRNGSYDVLALITTPGSYKIQIILDYTQCDGLEDPPSGWFAKSHCLKGTSKKVVEYFNQEVSPGLTIEIPSPKYDLTLLPSFLDGLNCGLQCQQVWDGHGSWRKHENKTIEWYWKETIPNVKKEGKYSRTNKSTLWIYGDSISKFLFLRLNKTELCSKTFKQCSNTYNWVYPVLLYRPKRFCDDIVISIERIQKYLKEAIERKDMDSDSTLMLNFGVHYLKTVSFQEYKDVMEVLIKQVQRYKGKLIWKSTTSIHQQDIERWRRYITSHRAELFNAYMNSRICSSNVTLLQIHPLTSSFPYGTKDGLHYDDERVFTQMEKVVIDYFRN